MMKTHYFILGLIFVCITSSHAQTLKVRNAQVNINNVQDNYGYSLLVGGYDMLFSANATGSQYMRFQIGSSNPRISGTGHCVVFYDARNSIFNDIQVRNVYNHSDRNAKTNILPIFNAIDKVNHLNPVSFNWIDKVARKSSNNTMLQEIGFIAQDVEQVLPEAVIEDEEGHKLVNYSAVIPVLTEALKELSTEIDKLKQEIVTLKSENSIALQSNNQITSINSLEDSNTPKAKLYQSAPNPSSGITKIKYTIAQFDLAANICFFDLGGQLISKKEINTSGEGEIVINANEFTPGMYIYSLIVDNQLIDTKRMILTN